MAGKGTHRTTGGVLIGSEYDIARTRKMNAEAEIAEMQLAKVRQELCLTEDVIKAWTDVLNACRAKFLALPTKAAPLLAQEDDAAVIKDLLEGQINEALAELANYDPAINPSGTSGAVESEEPVEKPEPVKRARGRPKKIEQI